MGGVSGSGMMGMAMAVLLIMHTSSQTDPDQSRCENQCLSDYFKESGGCSGDDAFDTADCITTSSKAAAGCVDDRCPGDTACATQCFADYLTWTGRLCSGRTSSETVDCITSLAGDAGDCVRRYCPGASACSARCLADYFATSGGCSGGRNASVAAACVASSSRVAQGCVDDC